MNQPEKVNVVLMPQHPDYPFHVAAAVGGLSGQEMVYHLDLTHSYPIKKKNIKFNTILLKIQL